MKLVLGLLCGFTLIACSTTDGLSESSHPAAPVAPVASPAVPKAPPSDPILLRKKIGASQKSSPEEQHFDCAVTAKRLPDAEHVKALIHRVNKMALNKRYILVPIRPTQEYYAYRDEQEIPLLVKGDAILAREPEKNDQIENVEVKELVTLLKKLCPHASDSSF